MAQHDYNLINQSGADFRADLNNALSAIATNNSGTSEPSTTFGYEWWIDEANGVLKIRNAANNAWITTGLNLTSSNEFTGNITGNAATATILATARTINGVSFNGSANISFNTDSVAEGSTNLYYTNERVDDRVNDLLVAGTGISLTYDDGSNTLTIANTNDADITGVVAGAALTGGGTSGDVTLNVAVDDSSIEINTDALRIKASGITNAMLAGSIANSKLSNSSVTINSQSLALGGSLDLDTSEIPENTNLYYTDARFDTRLGTKDTNDLTEGTNLYYTQTRFDTAFGNKSTTNLTEGTNLYYTSARANTDFDTRLATKDTANLTEGTNLYYTNERVDDRVSALIQDGTGISFSYNDGENTLTPTITLSPFNTSNLSESGNLYYTDARANSAIDARVTNTFINNLTGVVADTATALATARTIALAGDVVGSVSFDGTSNVSITTAIQADSVTLGTDTTGDYIQTITGTANKITVSGSGTESRDVTLTLPADVQIADSLTVAGNLTVNGTLVSLNSTNLDITDNLFQLNAGLTGSPVNDTGMLINRGNQDNGIFMWDESADKFTLGLTTADGSATGNITLSALGTLVANIDGAVTGTVSSLSNHDTADLAEGTNLYYTQARFNSALTAKSTSDLSEGTNLYYTEARVTANSSVAANTAKVGITPAQASAITANTAKITYPSADSSKLAGIEAQADVTDVANVTAAGALMDSELTSIASVKALNQGVATGDSPTFVAVTGTLATAAQPNITSVGTLSGLNVAGTPTFDGLDITESTNARMYSSDAISEVGDGNFALQVVNAAGSALKPLGFRAEDIRFATGSTERLRITDTGIDVTGTATMDGLTVDGSTALNNSSAGTTVATVSGLHTASGDVKLLAFQRNGGAVAGAITYADASTGMEIGTTTSHTLALTTGDTQRLRIASNGDISFYEDTGTTAKLFWDASDERLNLTGSDYQFGIKQGSNQPWYNRAVSDGSYRIHLNGTGDILTATSSGIDVTGTTTTNNLTIDDGVIEFDKPSVFGFRFLQNDAGNDLSIQQGDVNNANYETRLNIGSTGNVGIGGSPSVSLDIGSKTDAIKIPVGTTAQRPASPANGMVRYNTTESEYEIYKSNAWFILDSSGYTYSADFLVIAGGGGGSGTSLAGGGGAGGYRTSAGTSGGGASAESSLTFIGGTTYTITVGAGGSGGATGSNGGDSSISGSGLTTITSIGGGAGSNNGTAGASGGSGGGSGRDSVNTGGAGTSGQGFAGGNGGGSSNSSAASGGGGAGAVGASVSSPWTGGNGGVGVASTITGSSVYRAGGGGGAAYASLGRDGGTGGNGGGGNGSGNSATSATAGTANTGGGGGGGMSNSSGKAGGSGVVILRVATSKYSGITTGSPTVTTSGSNTIITFNSSGSYTA